MQEEIANIEQQSNSQTNVIKIEATIKSQEVRQQQQKVLMTKNQA